MIKWLSIVFNDEKRVYLRQFALSIKSSAYSNLQRKNNDDSTIEMNVNWGLMIEEQTPKIERRKLKIKEYWGRAD